MWHLRNGPVVTPHSGRKSTKSPPRSCTVKICFPTTDRIFFRKKLRHRDFWSQMVHCQDFCSPKGCTCRIYFSAKLYCHHLFNKSCTGNIFFAPSVFFPILHRRIFFHTKTFAPTGLLYEKLLIQIFFTKKMQKHVGAFSCHISSTQRQREPDLHAHIRTHAHACIDRHVHAHRNILGTYSDREF